MLSKKQKIILFILLRASCFTPKSRVSIMASTAPSLKQTKVRKRVRVGFESPIWTETSSIVDKRMADP